MQALAACIELADAWSLDNPEKHMSRLPVHQDGSCNGLQHYAALGGDMLGAEQVNLLPSERPQDVYEGVAEIVRGLVQRDAEAGDEIAQLLVGKITRKVVKQTVMTNVYGVTFVGARDQIEARLNDRGDVPEALVFKYVCVCFFFSRLAAQSAQVTSARLSLCLVYTSDAADD